MDSTEYFARAEKANKRYRTAVIIILAVAVVALFVAIALLFKINDDNHKSSEVTLNSIISNEVKLNNNLKDSVKCLFNTKPGQTPQQTIQAADQCFSNTNNINSPGK